MSNMNGEAMPTSSVSRFYDQFENLRRFVMRLNDLSASINVGTGVEKLQAKPMDDVEAERSLRDLLSRGPDTIQQAVNHMNEVVNEIEDMLRL